MFDKIKIKEIINKIELKNNSKISELNFKYKEAISKSKLFLFYAKQKFNNISQSQLSKISFYKLPNYSLYHKNIAKLLETKNDKKIYDTSKIEIATIEDDKKLYMSEFTYAKIRGYIKSLNSHSEIEADYFRLLPYLFDSVSYAIYKNSNNDRLVYVQNLDEKRKMLYIVDDSLILSMYIVNNKKFDKQVKNGRIVKINQLGETAKPLIVGELLPHSLQRAVAETAFWRQTDLLKALYQSLDNEIIKEEDFINLVDIIISSKDKIAKYNKHFDSLNAVDKCEIKEEIEKLESEVKNSIERIDTMVYKLYGLSSDEVEIVEGN